MTFPTQHHYTMSPLVEIRFHLITLVFLCLTLPRHGAQMTKKCPYNEAHTSANCSNMKLKLVPWNLHMKINTLDLSNNNFTVLDNQSFFRYKFMKHIYLRNNSLRVIQPAAFAFDDQSYVQTLDMSNNKLPHVPVDAINVISSSLIQLILAGNKLTHLARGAFSKLHNLKHLDLSGNRIYRVDYGAFRGLTSLTVLKLHHNAITYLPQNSFHEFPQASLTQVLLYSNRWVCDCKVRWMWKWLNETDSSVWESPGYAIRCDGPVLVKTDALDSLTLDKLACEVKMKTSGSTRELAKGANATLLCKYTTVPEAEAVWLKNRDAVDVTKHASKYSVSSWAVTGTRGKLTHVSELKINDFKYADIARYKCLIENIRGSAYTEYKLTLKGVDFDMVVTRPPVSQKSESGGVDTRSIVIAVAVVCGIILLIVIAVLIFCSVNRMQQKKQAKRDEIVEHVKEHFIKNSGDVGGGRGDTSTMESIGKTKPAPLLLRGVDSGHHPGNLTSSNNQDDNRSCSNHTNDSTYKAPLDLEESEPMLITSSAHSPGSPLNNGNTYVSFGSEFTDPGEFPSHVPVYSSQQPPIMNNRYDGPGGPGGSHEGSATPLLDRYTPVFIEERDEPMEDYASYPVYDSLTNSLQHPRHTPPQNNVSSQYNVYNPGMGDGGIYGTSPMHHNNQFYQRPPGGSVSSYNTFNSRNDGGPGVLNRSMGSATSFHYPVSQTGGSMPRTPGSVRSVAAVPPWNNSPGRGDGSPPIIENHYQPPPLVHRPNPEYRDYREMRFPPASTTTPTNTATHPSNRNVANTKNMGYSPAPSSGPRKPPRVYIPGSNGSRDCIELTTPVSAHDPNSIDYITSSEAHQYSQNYGITPGTPV